ncbi:hypothetical protein BO78DRAFT_452543 [Aspergillus sclerotiicarbonarius CBS 121057]|uniref:Xylanolytic transcriptional activator regulatory domain-containing protein n=1 Tax=Aspergillus sclerotiicarbonarius (strain CBS 121057 / IBT 28362) TaxID=1448318 RepID=A0A319EQM5_ASPSB|nr:hypothetical protein BO78DRAFT_452543 [Aspergillus sclerotiicarbonarius CBS 121057]
MPRVDVRRGNVTACTRCKSRKQRCDQQLPFVSPHARCALAAETKTRRVGCLERVPTANGPGEDCTAQSLEDRIAMLEKQLREHGVSVETPPPELPSASSPLVSPSPLHPRQVPAGVDQVLQQAAFVSLSATSFPRYMGAGCGLGLTRLLLVEIGIDIETLQGAAAENAEWFEPIDEMLFPSSPNQRRESVLQRTALEADLDQVYRVSFIDGVPDGAEHGVFRCFMVLAIGILLLTKKDLSTPYRISDQRFASAIKIVDERPMAIFTGDLDHMEAILLLAQYVSLHPKSSGAWHTAGLATRLAVDLGLHEAPTEPTRMAPAELDRRRRLFWAACSLELNVCAVLGRPCSIPDEAISADYPLVPDETGQQEQTLKRQVAVGIIRGRRLESEIHARLFQATPRGFPAFDFLAWKSSILDRVQQWYTERPLSSVHIHQNTFAGFYSNMKVLLHSPNKFQPALSLEEAIELHRKRPLLPGSFPSRHPSVLLANDTQAVPGGDSHSLLHVQDPTAEQGVPGG